jgi:hypothetical protein
MHKNTAWRSACSAVVGLASGTKSLDNPHPESPIWAAIWLRTITSLVNQIRELCATSEQTAQRILVSGDLAGYAGGSQ